MAYRLYDVVKFFFSQINRIGIRDRASAVAFNFIMAIPAAAIFIFTLIPYFPIAKNMQNELFEFIADVLPNSESRALIMTTMLDLFNKPKTGLLSIGFILALFYSSNAMLGIIRTFDASLLAKPKRIFMQRRLRAIKLTFVLILLVIVTILLSIGQGVLFASFLNWLGVSGKEKNFWTELLRWLIVVFLFFYSIAYTYKYAPSVKKRWKLWSPGAAFATFLIVIWQHKAFFNMGATVFQAIIVYMVLLELY